MSYPYRQSEGYYYDPSIQLSPGEQAQLDAVYRSLDTGEASARSEEYDGPGGEMNEEPSEPEQASPDDGPARSQGSNAKQSRQQKRREQNKAAQRNFRKRKEEHLSVLISRIEALELQKKSVQAENQELLREVVRKRAENISLRSQYRTDSSPAAPLPLSSVSDSSQHPNMAPQRLMPSQNKGKQKQIEGSDISEARGHLLSPLPIEALMTLYEPFLEVWEQIRSQPAVANGQVDADAVIDRLREMAKYEDEESQHLE